MQNNTLLTAGTEKLVKKLSCFYYSRWLQFFSEQMQDDILLTVCTKNLLLKLIVFTAHRGYKRFLNK